MCVRFLTTNQIKQGLKSKCTCCGLSKVVCGGLSAALTTYFGPTGEVADNHIFQIFNLGLITLLVYLFDTDLIYHGRFSKYPH